MLCIGVKIGKYSHMLIKSRFICEIQISNMIKKAINPKIQVKKWR